MSPELTPEEIAKLPKWAQHKIEILHMRLREARDEITRTMTNPKSNTWVRASRHTDDWNGVTSYLRNNEEVYFKPNEVDEIQVRVTDTNGPRRLTIRCVNGSVKILPEASNSFSVMGNR